jgi:peptide/nickel transport system substrate-binding protein
VPDTDIPDLRKNPAVTVQTAPTAVKHTFLFQTRDPLVGEVKLRRAIAAALDLPQLVGAVSNGLSEPNGSAIHTTSGYYGAAQKRNHVHDPALARRLLQEAGYKGEKIKMMANRRSIMPSFPAALIAQGMLQSVGINMEIEVLEWATQLDRYLKGQFQMMSFSYSARLDPAMSYEQFTGPKDKQPRKIWDNAEVQGLLERAMTISVEDERRRIFDDLHARQLAEVPLIILYNGVDSSATTRRFQGFRPWVASKPRLWEVKLD